MGVVRKRRVIQDKRRSSWGKHKTLNMIGDRDTPTTGDVYLGGRNLGEMSRSQLSRLRRDKIGFVFQAYNLVPVLTAFENAEMVLALQGSMIGRRSKRRRKGPLRSPALQLSKGTWAVSS